MRRFSTTHSFCPHRTRDSDGLSRQLKQLALPNPLPRPSVLPPNHAPLPNHPKTLTLVRVVRPIRTPVESFPSTLAKSVRPRRVAHDHIIFIIQHQDRRLAACALWHQSLPAHAVDRQRGVVRIRPHRWRNLERDGREILLVVAPALPVCVEVPAIFPQDGRPGTLARAVSVAVRVRVVDAGVAELLVMCERPR